MLFHIYPNGVRILLISNLLASVNQLLLQNDKLGRTKSPSDSLTDILSGVKYIMIVVHKGNGT